jgi:hypothetical protein
MSILARRLPTILPIMDSFYGASSKPAIGLQTDVNILLKSSEYVLKKGVRFLIYLPYI